MVNGIYQSLVTQVDSSDPASALWEREQVVVMLSRTPTAADMTFVTNDPAATARALLLALCAMTQFTRYICRLLQAFTGCQGGDPGLVDIDLTFYPFRPMDVPLPMDKSGCAYILVSCKDTNVTYIGGETECLSLCIDCHNSGHGSLQTEKNSTLLALVGK